MPLIKKPVSSLEKKQVRVRLEERLIEEITAYCNWAELPSVDYFLEQAALMALTKDKEWKKKSKSVIK